MSNDFNYPIANGAPVSVTSASSPASWSTPTWYNLLTAPFDLDGFYLSFQLNASLSTLFQIGLGSTPFVVGSNLPFGLGNSACNVFIPIRVRKGQNIQVQAASYTGSATFNMTCTGIPRGIMNPDFVGFQLVGIGTSLSFAHFQSTINPSSTLQMTTAVTSLPTKRIYISPNAAGPVSMSVGFGPSTSVTVTPISNINYSNNANIYGTINFDYPCYIPEGNNIFLTNLSSANTIYGGMAYLI